MPSPDRTEKQVIEFIKNKYQVEFQYDEDNDPCIGDMGIVDSWSLLWDTAKEFDFDQCVNGDEIDDDSPISWLVALVIERRGDNF